MTIRVLRLSDMGPHGSYEQAREQAVLALSTHPMMAGGQRHLVATPGNCCVWRMGTAPCHWCRDETAIGGACWFIVDDRCDHCMRPCCRVHARKVWGAGNRWYHHYRYQDGVPRTFGVWCWDCRQPTGEEFLRSPHWLLPCLPIWGRRGYVSLADTRVSRQAGRVCRASCVVPPLWFLVLRTVVFSISMQHVRRASRVGPCQHIRCGQPRLSQSTWRQSLPRSLIWSQSLPPCSLI